jgi:hypothetical protein
MECSATRLVWVLGSCHGNLCKRVQCGLSRRGGGMGILCIYRRCSSIGLDKGTAIRSDGNLGCVLSWRLMELRYGEEVEACIWRLNGEQTCFRTGT